MLQRPFGDSSFESSHDVFPSFESISACSTESGCFHGLEVDAEDGLEVAVEQVIAGIADASVQHAISLLFTQIKKVDLDVRLLKDTWKPTFGKSLDLKVKVQQARPHPGHAKTCDQLSCSVAENEALKSDVMLQSLSGWQPLPQVMKNAALRRAPMQSFPEMETLSPTPKEHMSEQSYGGSQPTKEQQNQGISQEQSEQEAGASQVQVRNPQRNGQVEAQLPMWLRPSTAQAPKSCCLPARKKTSAPLSASKFTSWPSQADMFLEAAGDEGGHERGLQG